MPQIIQGKQNKTLPQITCKINTNCVFAATAQAIKTFPEAALTENRDTERLRYWTPARVCRGTKRSDKPRNKGDKQWSKALWCSPTNTRNSAWTKKCPLQEQEIICISHQAGKMTLGVLRTHATLDAATRVLKVPQQPPSSPSCL